MSDALSLRSRWLGPLLLVAAHGALAQDGPSVTLNWTNLRAGPATDFPVVAKLPPRASLDVQGCIDGYTWCDVVAPDGLRGWIYAENIGYEYQGNRVPVLRYGPEIGLPIVTFAVGLYWGQYYRNRPWYHDMPRWNHWRPPAPPPPVARPRPPAVRPPPEPRPPTGHAPPSPRPPNTAQPPAVPRPPGSNPPPPPPRPPAARPAPPPRPPEGRPAAPPRPPAAAPRPPRDGDGPPPPGARPGSDPR